MWVGAAAAAVAGSGHQRRSVASCCPPTVPIRLAPRGFEVGEEGLGGDPDDGLEVVVVVLIHQEAVEDGEARALYWGGEMALHGRIAHCIQGPNMDIWDASQRTYETRISFKE